MARLGSGTKVAVSRWAMPRLYPAPLLWIVTGAAEACVPAVPDQPHGMSPLRNDPLPPPTSATLFTLNRNE